MYRYVMEELQPEKLKYDRYVFVGFNVLNKVENRFFERLRDAGRALFYWDYDLFYTRLPREKTPPYTHEAGEFILRNLKIFPNELPETAFDVLRHPKNVRFISAPTENAQARYLPEWIHSVMKMIHQVHQPRKKRMLWYFVMNLFYYPYSTPYHQK